MKQYTVLVEFATHIPLFNGKRLLQVGRYCHSFYAVKQLVSLKLDKPFILSLSINEFCDYCYEYVDFLDIKDVIVQKKLWR